MKNRIADLLSNQWTAKKMQTDEEELSQFVKYEVDEDKHVATITFNRPETLNALPVAGLEIVGDRVREAEYDNRVKVIVFRGRLLFPNQGVGVPVDLFGVLEVRCCTQFA